MYERRPRKLPQGLLFLAAAAPAALVYGLTLAPSLTWAHGGADGGSFLAAAASGGIPHPPGFPTYMLLARLALQLPWGNPAVRLNALSALAASLAAGWVACTVARSHPGRLARPAATWLAGLAAGWLLAFAPLVWSQAVITEVYTLAAAFAAGILFLARGGERRPAFGIGLVWGLGLGVHPSLLFLAPLLLLGQGRRPAALVLAGAAVGLFPYGLLPLWAAGNPAVSWGDPRSLAGWWWLVSGAAYRGYLLSLPAAAWPGRLLTWLVLLVWQFTPLGLPLALYGWSRLRKRAIWPALTEGATVLAVVAFSLAWGTSDSYLYLIPILVVLAIWAGEGLLELTAVVRAAWPDRPVVGRIIAMGLLLPLALLPLGWARTDLRGDRAAGRFAAAVMADAPPGAILLSGADRHTFALWAWEALSGGRLPGATAGPWRVDITVVDVDLLAFSWYRASLADQTGLSALDEAQDPWAVLHAAGRPLCRVDDQGVDCALPEERTAAAEGAGNDDDPRRGGASSR